MSISQGNLTETWACPLKEHLLLCLGGIVTNPSEKCYKVNLAAEKEKGKGTLSLKNVKSRVGCCPIPWLAKSSKKFMMAMVVKGAAGVQGARDVDNVLLPSSNALITMSDHKQTPDNWLACCPCCKDGRDRVGQGQV